MFDKGNTLTLEDNNEYAVVDKYVNNDTTYVYLVDINNTENIIFAKLDNDEIVTLTDPDEIEEFIKKVNEDLHSN